MFSAVDLFLWAQPGYMSLWLSTEKDDVTSPRTIRQINRRRRDMHTHRHHLQFHTLAKHKEVKSICLEKLAHILIPTVSLRQRRVWELCVSDGVG